VQKGEGSATGFGMKSMAAERVDEGSLRPKNAKSHLKTVICKNWDGGREELRIQREIGRRER